MKNDVTFTMTALQDYIEWQMTDRKIAARINALIKDIQRNGLMSGIGKPEALKTIKAYSRRIGEYHIFMRLTKIKTCVSSHARGIMRIEISETMRRSKKEKTNTRSAARRS